MVVFFPLALVAVVVLLLLLPVVDDGMGKVVSFMIATITTTILKFSAPGYVGTVNVPGLKYRVRQKKYKKF